MPLQPRMLRTSVTTMKMNLTTEPWIPVTDWRGQARHVSLHQLFAEGKTLRALAVRPHERVALMRLFICIAQAALDGPADGETLEVCGQVLPQAAEKYLVEWADSLDLHHPQKPFLQFAGLAKLPKPKGKSGTEQGSQDEGTSASKLDFALATGNNTTLFDNRAASEEPRAFEP